MTESYPFLKEKPRALVFAAEALGRTIEHYARAAGLEPVLAMEWIVHSVWFRLNRVHLGERTLTGQVNAVFRAGVVAPAEVLCARLTASPEVLIAQWGEAPATTFCAMLQAGGPAMYGMELLALTPQDIPCAPF